MSRLWRGLLPALMSLCAAGLVEAGPVGVSSAGAPPANPNWDVRAWRADATVSHLDSFPQSALSRWIGLSLAGAPITSHPSPGATRFTAVGTEPTVSAAQCFALSMSKPENSMSRGEAFVVLPQLPPVLHIEPTSSPANERGSEKWSSNPAAGATVELLVPVPVYGTASLTLLTAVLIRFGRRAVQSRA